MGRGFHIGRILGININIDYSWIIIFILITFELSAGIFPAIHPNWGVGKSLGIGIAASILFFSSVLLHELMHSVVARSQGIPVRNITLFLFGGVSDIEREPSSAVSEFLIAVVGPMTSLVLGTILFFASGNISSPLVIISDLGALSSLSPVATLLFWLGAINLFLGFFNLIPGFPLDGGRVLRSMIWFATGNLYLSTSIASVIGRGVAWLFILSGIAMILGFQVPILGSGLFNGIWLILIGWFLNSAASVSFQEMVLEDTLKNVKVAALMRTEIPAVTSDFLVSGLVERLLRTKEDNLPVLEDNHLVGIVGLADIRRLDRDLWGQTTVREIMIPAGQLQTLSPDEPAVLAMRKIRQNPATVLPVVENGRFVGVVEQRDISSWLQLHK